MPSSVRGKDIAESYRGVKKGWERNSPEPVILDFQTGIRDRPVKRDRMPCFADAASFRQVRCKPRVYRGPHQMFLTLREYVDDATHRLARSLRSPCGLLGHRPFAAVPPGARHPGDRSTLGTRLRSGRSDRKRGTPADLCRSRAVAAGHCRIPRAHRYSTLLRGRAAAGCPDPGGPGHYRYTGSLWQDPGQGSRRCGICRPYDRIVKNEPVLRPVRA